MKKAIPQKVIVFRKADGALKIRLPHQPPADGESEGQWLDGEALPSIHSKPEMRPESLTWSRQDRDGVSPAELPMGGKKFWLLKGAETYPFLSGIEENRINHRDCWRWQGGRVVIALPLLRAEIVRVVTAECDRRRAAVRERWIDAMMGGRKREADELAVLSQRLRDLPATVAADLERLTTAEQLEQYAPTWPT